MTYNGTIKKSDMIKLGFYFNTKRYPESKIATMLKESGGDIIMNASIFLRTGKPACYLKADGVQKCTPTYGAYGLAWSNPPVDLDMVQMKGCSKDNYIHDCYLIYDGQKISKPNYGADRRYACNRTAIGLKNGEFAYYATEDNLSPEQLQARLIGFGWSDAIMLDGGGSTTIWFKNGKGFIGSDPNRYIPFYLVVWLKSSGNQTTTSTTSTATSNTSTTYPVPTRTLKYGMSGNDVMWLQDKLNKKIGAGLPVNGGFYSLTKKAVIAFQKKQWPTDKKQWDGIVGAATRKALM